MPAFRIVPIDESPVSDQALEELLTESYVGGGFTAPDVAGDRFRAEAVKRRGRVFVAHDDTGRVAGTITLVTADSPARRLAVDGEAELHLLCVRPEVRGGGLGRALVETAIEQARGAEIRRILLWTQPTMHAAQRLYERVGFRREPTMTFTRGDCCFLVYALNV